MTLHSQVNWQNGNISGNLKISLWDRHFSDIMAINNTKFGLFWFNFPLDQQYHFGDWVGRYDGWWDNMFKLLKTSTFKIEYDNYVDYRNIKS